MLRKYVTEGITKYHEDNCLIVYRVFIETTQHSMIDHRLKSNECIHVFHMLHVKGHWT